MKSKLQVHTTRISLAGCYAISLALLTAAALLLLPLYVEAQGTTFTSGSDGSDGALDYSSVKSGTTVYFDPVALGLKGNQDQLCIFNFTTITIPTGVTVKLSANKLNCPIYWLASGDVDIEGTLDLSGAPGGNFTLDVDVRVPATPGSGGYSGGVGGNNTPSQPATAGNGPGGGAPGQCGVGSSGGGTFSGNQFLVPLFGGSGGGGIIQNGQFGAGGGAGGGAILIASSTQIIVNGTINANGGQNGGICYSVQAGGGSGGAIRLVSNTITGTGNVTAQGNDQGYSFGGSPGRVRLEANTISCCSSILPTPDESNPLLLVLPSTPPASVLVTSVGGTAITENPFSFPDITINNSSSISVVITAHQVPVGTIPTLYVFSEKGDQVLPCTGGLQGSLATSTCTLSIPFPYGGSRGFVKATW